MSAKNMYVNGSAVRKADVRYDVYAEPTHRVLRELENDRKRVKKNRMSFLYVAFLVAAFIFLGSSLVSYIKLRAEISAASDRVSYYEQEYNNLVVANDDEYSKIVDTIDLEEIRRVAIEDLGMVYADESQIITYTRESSDYVRQLKDIND